ncbi:tetratricopeptide repeat protein [uncultured Desulfuromonas sp.]|uniref:tetratricopeptide repeat protein n=1 Tax=uncultured Desulfuromonas sp. TaxID=181013 RepID=UPI002AAC0190|nr:tetratricopeptide repeat protein [uncultured Desulfuromonas sp.]
MANKDKILATAQKYLQKNNLARAVKEYLKVLKIDERDVRSRQKLAELYSRLGKTEEALAEYETVAAHYAENTFYLKAIAVYKQMQKLDPQNTAYTLKLAKLNEQQGLVGNALSEYRVLLQHHQHYEEHDEVIKVLLRMQELDPENITIGMQMAEFYAKIDKTDEAIQAFEKVEQRIHDLGNYKQLQKFYERFSQVWPDNLGVKVNYGVAMIEFGEPLVGVQFLSKLQRQHPQDLAVLSALALGCHACNEFSHELECLQKMVQVEPDNLDYWLRLYQASVDVEQYELTLSSLEKKREAFFAAERVAELKPYYEKMYEVFPDNKDLLSSLHAVYEHLGEGEKLFNVLSGEDSSADDLFAGGGEDDFTPSEDFAAGDVNAVDTLSFDDMTPAANDESASGDPVEFEELEFDLVDDVQGEADEASFDDISFDLSDDDSGGSLPVDIQTDLEEADFYLQQGLLDEADQVCKRLAQACPGNADVQQRLDAIASRRQGSKPETAARTEPQPGTSPVQAQAADSEESFDLDMVIDDSFVAPLENVDLNMGEEDIDSSLEGTLGQSNAVDEMPALADSQRGVQTVIGDEDTESAYNLGVAYKEMGLYDDAIAEFDKSIRSPLRKIDSLALKAACYIDQQKFDQAEDVLTQGLSDSLLSTKDRVVLYYETGLLYEAWHRYADALASYQVVADNDATFRDVSIKIIELKELVDDDSGSAQGESRVSYL